MIDLTIVVPVYNEEHVLPLLHPELQNLLSELKKDIYRQGPRRVEEIEILFVNDGSTDNSMGILHSLAQQCPAYRIISFSRNFGHQAAVSAGVNAARGKAVAIIDADLQDPPMLVKDMVRKWQEGFDVVYALRKERRTTLLMSLAYRIYYRFQKLLADDPVQVDAGDFGLLDRKVVDILNLLPEKERYMRGLRSWIGFKQIGIEYRRDERKAGKSKYSFLKLCKLAFHGILSTSVKPLFFSGVLSLLSVLFAFGMIAYSLIAFLILPQDVMPKGWTSLMMALSILSASQLLSIWMLSIYMAKVYREILARPIYIIAYDSLGNNQMDFTP